VQDERSATEDDRGLGASEPPAEPAGEDRHDRPLLDHAVSVALQSVAMSTSGLVDIDDARGRVLGCVTPLESEAVELGPAVQGRVLAEDVTADEPVPAFDSSAMDGFAVRAEDLAGASASEPITLRVTDEARAGAPAARAVSAGEAISISTGAVIPAGADAIVRIEDTRQDGDRVQIRAAPAAGRDVRRTGEDIRAGQAVLGSGTVLGPAELGVLASLGRGGVECARRPRVSVLVTGDELVGPGEPMRPGGVRDSSSQSISALVRSAGGEVVYAELVRDDAVGTREAIARAVEDADVTVICGGVSVGSHDHVRPALQELGAQQVFWGVALRPGRPTWFGTAGRGLVFGLPGNPVSAIVTFVLLVRPALRALLGARDGDRTATAVIDSDYTKRPGRAHAVRCRLIAREDGWHAEPTGAQGSHILTSMLGADVLAMVPSDTAGVRAGERVGIEPLWKWVLAPT
jgi:molybdopterin molybdotransferase